MRWGDNESFEGQCKNLLRSVGKKKPLVHCITNFVSMDIMANCLCAIGASPAMVHSEEEVEEFSKKASVLLVNVGTLSKEWLHAMHKAVKAYNARRKPWVLDPVAAGATKYRTQAILDLLEQGPAIVRGNASEIKALADQMDNPGGVDSSISPGDAQGAAKKLAVKYNTVVAVSGDIDFVTDGVESWSVHDGHPLITLISAAGCSVTAIIAAFLAAAGPVSAKTRLFSAVYGLAVFGFVANKAVYLDGGVGGIGPGTLRVRLLDGLHEAATNNRAELNIAITT